MAEVKLINIGKTYDGGNVAVSEVNIEIHDKEFLVLVGPSGCGKSTTLRMIAGLEDISFGELYIDGKLMNNIPPSERDIAMVFQNYALYPHMTVFENMAFGLKIRKYKKSEIEERVHYASDILELKDLLHRRPKELSGGQRQRVAVGRAIVRKPKVFLFDEPLSNLDAKLRVQMRTEISKLHSRLNSTMIYVTHDQTEAMTLGDRIVLMKDGFIQQIDTPLNIYNYPLNSFVAGFIGSPSMNFIEGTIKNNGALRFISDDKSMNIPIPNIILQHLEKCVDREIIFGFRPESVQLSEVNDKSEFQFQSDIILVEPMGFEIAIYFLINGKHMTARLAQSEISGNYKNRKFNILPNKFHFFDKESGLKIY